MSETGNGNLPVVRVDNEFCVGEVYIHGATVTAWQPKGQGPVLWLSERSAFDGEAPIRGGVPICFPGMVCVEAANALDESYSLKPGGSHTLATRITVA